jgi:ribosomal protein S18 acetylase RimI-like enzyme
MKKNRIIIFLATIFLFSAVFGWWVYKTQKSSGPTISEYQDSRDRVDVIEIFRQNWWWLIAGKDFSQKYVEDMLDKRTPKNNPRLIGSLQFRVLRIGNNLAAFSAFYMEKKDTGRLLFLVTDENHRKKGYAELLAKETLNIMKKMGAKRIWLLTRANNERAQQLYRKLGFQEFYYDPDGFVHFEIVSENL